MTATDTFEGWAILELMGHRRLAGYLTEHELAGGKFLRIDVPKRSEGVSASQFYSPAAVYCITPTTEEIARAVAARSQPAPVERWELPALERKTNEVDAEVVDDAYDPIDDHEWDAP